MPGQVAVHFDAPGRPDGTVTKPVAVILAPVVGAAAVLLVRYGPAVGRSPPPRVTDATVMFVGTSVASVQVLIDAWNRGVQFSPVVATVPVLVGATVLVGDGTTGA